ncbi:hypothetical protein BH11MYX3_BH11MYX3_16710 [soil metagenome]
MRVILMVGVLSACAAGNRSTRVLQETEYIAFADRPTDGYAPMAPPECTANEAECAGQWLAEIQIGEHGGTIERVMQTRAGFQIYVRPSCDGESAPNWTLMLRKPVVPVNVVKLANSRCDPLATQQAGAAAGTGFDGTM